MLFFLKFTRYLYKQKNLQKEIHCEPDRIRTCDRLLRREVLYPAELRARSKKKVGVAGFEPAASTSQTWRDNRATLHPVTYLLYSSMSIKPKIKRIGYLAERQGFEPWVPLLGYDDLANRSFRPLRHLSFAIKIIKIASANVIFKKHSCKLKTTFFK